MTATPSPLLTDLYQLTMIAAYVDSGKAEEMSTFDLFIRRTPKDWGYLVAAGVDEAADIATRLKFSDDDLAYLRSTGIFQQQHLQYFKDFRFTGEIASVAEGGVVSANTPIMRVTAPRAQAQLLETILLNTIGYQTMVATKASRTVDAAQGRSIVDFGLRRAQGQDAGLKGARAAYIAGASGTSNVLAGKEYGLPIIGTHAHSFVMSYDAEEEAFQAYAQTFPQGATLLVDTYDTSGGVENAIMVAKALEREGKRIGAIRLDSGDLETLARDARKELDAAGLDYVRITASGDLNEYKVTDLVQRDAPIDAFGVGTEMITGKPDAALSAVYKLAEDNAGAKLKLAEGKRTWPGKKQVWRVTSIPELDDSPVHQYDILALESEGTPDLGEDAPYATASPRLRTVVRGGWRVTRASTIEEARERRASDLAQLPGNYREVRASESYEMRPSAGLAKLAGDLAREHEHPAHDLTQQQRLEQTIKRWKEVAA